MSAAWGQAWARAWGVAWGDPGGTTTTTTGGANNSAWGTSWGSAWGNSWGPISAAVAPGADQFGIVRGTQIPYRLRHARLLVLLLAIGLL